MTEKEYIESVNQEHRKKFAQFFTPPIIAEKMVNWLLGNNNLKNVLEPAFGLGIFSKILLHRRPNVNILGFDIDKIIIDKARSYFNNYKNVSIHNKDYMTNDWNKKYDGIICNPPYFKFHDYDNKNTIDQIEKKLNCKLNGFTNLYTLFLLKSINQLKKNGRCAYIIPSEFMNSDYGINIKQELLKSKTLRHIIVINFKENIFDGALTTASIILCSNDNNYTAVGFTNIESLSDLSIIDTIIEKYNDNEQTGVSDYYSYQELDTQIKWKKYYQKQNKSQYIDLVSFSNYAIVKRGIATGANDYFVFNNSKAKKHNINKKYLLPCLCKSNDINKPIFTEEDYKRLKNEDKNVFLLNALNSSNQHVINYINKGIDKGIDKKYLTSSRKPWYSLEKRIPSPIWVSVFNRNKGLKFIRNEANISNLTTFHCIYIKNDIININLFFAYLLTPIANDIFMDNCREYGNGLIKFEPNDLNNSMMLNLDLLSEDEKNKIIQLYTIYRDKLINKGNPDTEISLINDILIKKFATK